MGVGANSASGDLEMRVAKLFFRKRVQLSSHMGISDPMENGAEPEIRAAPEGCTQWAEIGGHGHICIYVCNYRFFHGSYCIVVMSMQ